MSKLAFLKKLLAGIDPESQWSKIDPTLPSKPLGEFGKAASHSRSPDVGPDDIQKARGLLTHKKFMEDAANTEREEVAGNEKFAKLLALLAGGAIAAKSASSEEEE